MRNTGSVLTVLLGEHINTQLVDQLYTISCETLYTISLHSDSFDGERLFCHFYRIADIYNSIGDISK